MRELLVDFNSVKRKVNLIVGFTTFGLTSLYVSYSNLALALEATEEILVRNRDFRKMELITQNANTDGNSDDRPPSGVIMSGGGHVQPGSTGRPPNRVSGGDRGNQCLEALVALVPGSDNVSLDDSCSSDSTSELVLTSAEQSILWFYIPEGYASAPSGTLYVMNQDGQAEFEQIVQLSGQSGIVSIQLEQPLEVGRAYRWLFEIRASARRSENPFVEGLIQRELPSDELASQLDTASELEQAQLYLNAGLWHDALTQLLQIQQTGINTPEWQSIWMSTLESEGLGVLSEMPITDCCIPERSPATPEL